MTDDFTIDDVEQLELDFRAEEVAKHHAKEFIDDLIDTAGHTLRIHRGDVEGVIRECAATLYDAGFDPQPEELDADPVVCAFAGFEVYHELEAERAEHFRVTDTPPVTVAGHYPTYIDPVLPDRMVIMIHRDAVCPSPPGYIEQPWFVEHPDGVVVAEVEA